LRSRIEALRKQQATKKQLPEELRASDASKTTLITELKKQSNELRTENQKLKRELKDAYGQALGLNELKATNRNLEKQNQHPLNLLPQARAEAEALKEQK
jgi:membrane-associated HD superfamily phosphohydrolase